jgi:hypothetical protein
MFKNERGPEPSGVERDTSGEVCVATRDWQSGETLACSVTEAVSEATDTAVDGMRPLFEVVDVDALNQVLESTSGSERPRNASIQFEYEGCGVSIDSDGRITVSPLK